MVSTIRMTARVTLALRASESVLRKFLEDDMGYWFHVNLTTIEVEGRGIMPEEDAIFSGIAWSPVNHRPFRIEMDIRGRFWSGRYLLEGAHVYCCTNDNVKTANYLFTYEGVDDLKGLVSDRLKYPDGALPGFFVPKFKD